MKRNRRGRATLVAWSVVVASAFGAGRAAAEATPEEKALATTLFNEAKTLLDAGKIPEACRKLEESERIYPAGGTLLNLAVCHEKEGKTATAWAEFREARVIAQRDQRDDRIALAEEHLKALEPKLSKLVITVSPAVDVPSMEITLDGHPMKRPAWGTQAPVDPGEHLVEAVAPGKKKWSTHVNVAPSGDTKTVVIPAWEDAPAAPPPVTPPTSTTDAPATVRIDTPPVPPRTVSRTPAIIAGAIGIGGIAMGSYFGLRAIAKHNDSNDACTTNPCGADSVAANNASKTAADISTGAFIVGFVGLGLGAYFWFTGGESSAPTAATRTVRIAPSIAPGRGTLDVVGTF